ncbi:ATP-binding cassette domain-containing protein [Sulfuracidifex tepidarius]|uniref:Molybdate/tungstate import ATP-binding protein WtpC n=1 Tax=Sulfuracidifex tepidarius TaxID=1294262 RepID=A0A510DUS8_9CREN|nr:ATP-binding cassette domain-containing protein [Sulfuracidifex tepidarius]BBG23929.1 Molybdate/tungstate import ATP-binding protein WtpC [Sulfuracidifex tepidarius]BBG26684.1 Molybdate/tungstate import ATP-binding protein WtpC [Sulfuracidifex tepidarius]
MMECSVKKRLKDFFLDVNLKEEGNIAITGENGSGKSTLARIVSGSLKQDEGYVRINGRDVTHKKPGERGVVLVTPSSFVPNFTPFKHLKWGYKAGLKRGNILDLETVIQELKLPVTEKKLSELSLGNRERVSLATALIGRPDVIIADEAFSNINDRESFMQSFISLCKKNSIQLIYITQDIKDVNHAEHHYIMRNGRLEREY